MKIKFITSNPNDFIQLNWTNGRFYEQEELELMQQYCNPESVIIDVGANVGNHSLYFSKYFNAKEIFAIEPVPMYYTLLLANLFINKCYNVNVDYIGLALGPVDCVGWPVAHCGPENLGATKIFPSETVKEYNNSIYFDPVNVVPGDSIFKDKIVNFIKIDVEGVEIVTLMGLKETIDKNRPNIFIEVNENENDFKDWLASNHYKIVYHNKIGNNYMIIPN